VQQRGFVMSLNVNKCIVQANDDWDTVEEQDYRHTLAGFEGWRDEVYGSELAITLGCTMLPLLCKHDLYCFTEDYVIQLLADTRLLLSNLSLLADVSGKEQAVLLYPIQNIQNAALWALENGEGVLIW
jgi:hypothetical protein